MCHGNVHGPVAATDGQIPKLFVKTSVGLRIVPPDPQPSPQPPTRPPWPPGTPTRSTTTRTRSPSTPTSTPTRIAAIEAASVAAKRSTPTLPQRFSRTAHAQYDPKLPWQARQHGRDSKCDRCATCTRDSSAERHAHTVHHPDMRERMPGHSGNWLRYRPQPASAMAALPRARSHVLADVRRDRVCS